MGHERREQVPHPLAGQTGEGAPFAPPNWIWKAGQRLSDMYFCSPEGRRVRSQIQLQDYLSSIPNPPPFSQFCWRVTPEGVEAFSKKQQQQAKESMDDKKSEDEGKSSSSPKRKRLEHKEDMMISPNNNAKRMTRDSLKVHAIISSKPQVKEDVNPPIDAIEHPCNPSLDVLLSTVKPIDSVSPVAGKRRKKTEARLAGALKHSFQSILSSTSSYKWLYNGNDVCRQFLEEAERLKGKSAAEKIQLRQLLLKRELEAGNLAKYDTPVLRVFVSILRDEDPPSSVGKAELLSLCVNWHCKHKHYWCVLETGQLRHLLPPSTELVLPKLKLIGSGHLHGNQNGLLELGPAHVKEREVHQYSDVATGTNNPVTGNNTYVDDDVGYCTENKTDEEFTALSYFQNFKHEETGLPAHFDLNGTLEIGKDGELLPLNGARVDAHNTSTGGQADVHDWRLEDSAGQMIVEHRQAQLRNGLHDTVDFAKSTIQTDFPAALCEPASSICLCQTCINEPSFCRGCTCSFCKVAIWPDENWKVLECAACGHICHFLCAFNQQQAGVFKDSGVDGEWECPGCAHKSDLLPFWRKRVKSAVSYGQVEEIEKHLLLAVLTLKDSEREVYQHLQCKVMEAHRLVQQGSPNTALFDLLQVIQEELDRLADEEGTLTGEDAEWAREALEMGQDYNWHGEEQKILTLQKQAKVEYEEWERAEKEAETQRALLAEHVERADAEAKAHAQRATVLSLQAYKGHRRMQVIKLVQAKLGVTLEQVERQQAEVQRLTNILQQLQHKVAYFEFQGRNEESALMFSKLLEQLMAQRELVQSAQSKLDYMLSLYKSR
ncbi:hypothetical protein BDL97_18G072800 [Sphagnum fallax]|nr:hypothetical protein BDL97_18G072800 [Sphagnum fallax]KAH8934240.1 hypothetical protein BDL97_18G072800 [Sphagnum fallax]